VIVLCVVLASCSSVRSSSHRVTASTTSTTTPYQRPKVGAFVHGVTGSFANVGDDLLCIGRFRNDPQGTCGAVKYPGHHPGCAFAFNRYGGQAVTARVLAYEGPKVVLWEPITVDGKQAAC